MSFKSSTRTLWIMRKKIVGMQSHTLDHSWRRIAPFAAALIVGAIAGLGYVFAYPTPSASTSSVIEASVHFSVCGRPPHANCVIDGDTFYLGTRSIRIADIDTPETHPSRCPYEAQLGERATRRLHELLNAGSFVLQQIDRDTDQYGRQLRIVVRDGKSVGDILVSEGLARKWSGRRQPWCS